MKAMKACVASELSLAPTDESEPAERDLADKLEGLPDNVKEAMETCKERLRGMRPTRDPAGDDKRGLGKVAKMIAMKAMKACVASELRPAPTDESEPAERDLADKLPGEVKEAFAACKESLRPTENPAGDDKRGLGKVAKAKILKACMAGELSIKMKLAVLKRLGKMKMDKLKELKDRIESCNVEEEGEDE